MSLWSSKDCAPEPGHSKPLKREVLIRRSRDFVSCHLGMQQVQRLVQSCRNPIFAAYSERLQRIKPTKWTESSGNKQTQQMIDNRKVNCKHNGASKTAIEDHYLPKQPRSNLAATLLPGELADVFRCDQ